MSQPIAQADLVSLGIVRTLEEVDRISLQPHEAFALYLWAFEFVTTHTVPSGGVRAVVMPRIADARAFVDDYRADALA